MKTLIVLLLLFAMVWIFYELCCDEDKSEADTYEDISKIIKNHQKLSDDVLLKNYETCQYWYDENCKDFEAVFDDPLIEEETQKEYLEELSKTVEKWLLVKTKLETILKNRERICGRN